MVARPTEKNSLYGQLGVDGFGVLSDQALDQIIKSTGITPVFPENAACRLLRDECLDLVRHSTKRTARTKEYEQYKTLVDCVADYHDAKVQLFHGLYYPPPPLTIADDWLRRAEEWLIEMEPWMAPKKGAQPKWWLHHFRPVVLGLYLAIYGEEPKSSIPNNAPEKRPKGEVSGATIVFVQKLIGEVRSLIDSQDLAQRLDLGPALKNNWTTPTDTTVHGWIRKERERAKGSPGDQTRAFRPDTPMNKFYRPTYIDKAERYKNHMEWGFGRVEPRRLAEPPAGEQMTIRDQRIN